MSEQSIPRPEPQHPISQDAGEANSLLDITLGLVAQPPEDLPADAMDKARWNAAMEMYIPDLEWHGIKDLGE